MATNRRTLRVTVSTVDRQQRAIARRKADLRAAHIHRYGTANLSGGEMIRRIRRRGARRG